MSEVVPITVPARDEERSIDACLASLEAAIEYAEARLPLRYEVQVACDRCVDRTAEIARARGVRVVEVPSPGGKVEAQRLGAYRGPFQIFCDADITLGEDS